MTSWIVSEDVLARVPIIRDARRDDVPRIVELFHTDEPTSKHTAAADAPPADGYYATFDAIECDPRNRLLVAEVGGIVAGTFQLTLVPDMGPSGAERAIVENVIVHSAARNRGIGAAMMRWAIDEAKRLSCSKVSLTSGKKRKDAHRFYARLGFTASHEGFAIYLEE